ncbi:MAG: protein kinase [Candidatus Omnitrophica bacterium]|nr:protein kinase [Candidatus Omnitrophota bacterium]
MTNQSSVEQAKESHIKVIESQGIISGRFDNPRRIDSDAGDGNFSLVFKAEDRSKKNRAVILKFYNPLQMGDSYRLECFQRESDMLKKLHGQRNILPLIQEKVSFTVTLEAETKEGKIQVPWQYMYYVTPAAKMSVKDYIYNERSTNYLHKILIFREMCKAIQRIHAQQICHRDVKPGNFLIYKSRYLCLSDFGTARPFGERSNPIIENYSGPVGDLRYSAPEILCGLHFQDVCNYRADIYGLGVVLFELFTKNVLGTIVFNDRNDLSVHFHTIPEHNREEIYFEVIDTFSRDRVLPSILDIDNTIPKVIAREVDVLYKSMAAIDYRKREADFKKIFTKINLCEKIIRYQKQYEIWKQKKSQKKSEGV